MKYYPKIELDIEKAAEFLGLPPSRLQELVEKKKLQENWDEYNNIYRFEGHVSNIENGTVLIDRFGSFELVRGFPKIKRAMLLEPAVKKHFAEIDHVVVEEKMNGYNVRVIDYNNKLIAFTRSGHVCPYSTERIQKFLKRDFFRDYPDIIVYGEMVGPDNPYVQKYVYGIESLEFFVFDMRYRNSGESLPIHKRKELAEEYAFDQVNLFGKFSIEEAPGKITDIIKQLGKKGHEGVIIKDPDMVLQPMKYTCSESNCSDLQHAFKFYNETGRDFLFSRVVREGFQSYEWQENEEDFQKRCLRLGESLLSPMKKTIAQVQSGQRISDDFKIRVGDKETIRKFRSYLQRFGLHVVFEIHEKKGDEYIINIRKVNKSTNDKTFAMLEGQLWS
ncbi:MAG: RNA ligase [Methanolobus sp.]|jgi:putative ATP-dependent DNA ligase|nr:RNA ligase [Methanolobus sp.]